MNSKNTQINNGVLYVVELAITTLLPVLVLRVFTRILTSGDYGLWALAQVYAVFVTGFCNVGLLTAFERNFFEDKTPEGRQKLFCTIWLFVAGCMVLGAGVTFIFSGTLSQWIIREPGHGTLLLTTFCSTCIISLNQYGLMWLKNTEQAKSYLHLGVAEKVTAIAVSLLLVAGFRIGVQGLVLGQLAGAGLLFFLLGARLFRNPIFDRDVLFHSLRIGFPLTPRIFLGVINSQFDKYMIGLMNTIGGVGIYSIGQMLANGVFLFMTAIQNVFAPQVYRRMFELGAEGSGEIGRYLTPFIYISVGVALLVAFFAEEVIMILMPPSYHSAANIVMIMACYYALLFFSKQPQLIYAKKTHISSLLGIASVVLNVGLNIPLIRAFGAIGAAWATLLSGLFSGALIFIVSQKYYHIGWQYRRITAMYLILGLGVLALFIPAATYPMRIFIKCTGLVLYGFLGHRIGILTKEHILLVRDQLFRKNFQKA